MKRIIKKVIDYQINGISNDLKKKLDSSNNLLNFLKIESTKSTANYILKNFSGSILLNSREELYNFIVDKKIIVQQYLEFGVWQGESINFFSSKFPNSQFYGFDSFEGLPENWRPGFEKGTFSLNGMLPKVNANVKLIPGWFNESLPNFLENINLDSNVFIHIDCDLYSSTKDVFDIIGEKLKGNVYILFDEYFNYPFWEYHEFKAFHEFIKKFNYKYEYVAVNLDHEQVLIKISI